MLNLLTATVITFAAFLALIAIHEFAHAAAATHHGLVVKRIKAGNGWGLNFTLGGVDHRLGWFPWSGQCLIEGLDRAPAKTRLVTAAAGPAASAATAAALYLAYLAGDAELMLSLSASSLMFAGFNLLPIRGLDGHVMLKAWRERKTCGST
ncbi:site-2 protease family protein [Ramlibacter alkalitolerans]|uniref:Peptidase M50 domain-containing protein n=1 Tax=Ramlibacter alkalitolerans TaxID=2039631 RepID=A0ABS1JUB6_9BURK|nr:site-2 protease family protein [Ramlibacter alkalitolerans]MBL0427813.1 hypothetical protein [Ramlibacter alkalitolerans]